MGILYGASARRSSLNFGLHSPSTQQLIFEATGNFSSAENYTVCGTMATPLEYFLDGNPAIIPALMDDDAEFSQQLLQGAESSFQKPLGADTKNQQSRRTTKSSESAKRAKLATISLEDYMHVFNRLTDGKGNVVQPNCDIKLFTGAQLRSNNMLLSLVGVELWSPWMLSMGPLEPGLFITDEQMMEDLHVLQW